MTKIVLQKQTSHMPVRQWIRETAKRYVTTSGQYRLLLQKIDSLSRANEELAQRVCDITNEAHHLRQLVKSQRNVDAVDFGWCKILMYVDDLAYMNLSDSVKQFSISTWSPGQQSARVNGQEARDVLSEPYWANVFEHYWNHDIDFCFVDIGCQYGTSALSVAEFIRRAGKQNRVVAFEPGVTRYLVPYNIAVNRMTESIKFEPRAVSARTGPVIMFTELGHSENNRVVNRTVLQESLSYVIDGVSIDDYVSQAGLEKNLIVKIDTQGAEYEVLQGMMQTLATSPTTFAMEFTPWALDSRVNPCQLLHQLEASHIVVWITEPGKHHQVAGNAALRVIHCSDFELFTAMIRQTDAKWTDLLLIPKNLPGVGELVNRLTAA